MNQTRFVQKAAQEKTGAMVALFLDSSLAKDLAIPGGLPPEELHITLAYLGEADDIEDQGGLIRAVSGLAESLGVLSGRLNGLARFKAKNGDKTPYVILPDLPDLPEARQLIVSTLRENGYKPSRDHGYIPHITIAYQDDGDPWPADNVGERKITFKTISLCLGSERHDFDLTGRYPVINKMDFFNERSESGDSPFLSPDIIKMVWKGGPTSGNWGHVGRPGKHGGSARGGGHKAIPFSGKPTRRKVTAAAKKVRKQRTEKRAFEKAKETLLSGRGLENLSRAELATLSARLDGLLGKSGEQNTKIAKEKPGNQKGAATIALGATPDKRYNMQYEVVELSDLVASNTQGGGINPAFPKELQPRDRSRAASKAQINKIASNLEPDALLGEFSSIDRGTPILGLDDNAVESGNGRTLALQRAKDAHPEQWNKYQNRLKETAQDRGIDPATLDGYENPVLIRRRTDKGVDRVQFAKDANTAQILGESASERARNDASRITSESLQHIDVRGDINATIQAPTNRAFVRNFIANTPETERAALMTGDGNLTKVGRDRIKGAMFNRVYDSPELSDKIFEALDDDTKNLTNGLMNSLGSMSKAQELVRTGQRAKDLDIAGDITRAVTEFDRLKASGQNIDTFLSQGNLFGDGLNPTQTKILREIDKRRRSGKKMQEFFEVWPKLVDQEPHPQQAGLFGSGGRSKSQLVDDWITMANRDNPGQMGLFSTKGDFITDVGFISPDIIKAVWKGGPTSGNWGHKGRPGKHGGSMSGGGLSLIGVSGDSPLAERKQATQAFRQAAKGGDIDSYLASRRTKLESMNPLKGALKKKGINGDAAMMYMDVMTLDEARFDTYAKKLGLNNPDSLKKDVFNRQGFIDRDIANARWELQKRNTHTPSPELFSYFDSVDNAPLIGKSSKEAMGVLRDRYNVRVLLDGDIDPGRVHYEVSRLLHAADGRPAVANTLRDHVETLQYNAKPKHDSHTAVANYENDKKRINVFTSNYSAPLGAQTLVHEVGHAAEEYAGFGDISRVFGKGKRVSMYAWGNHSEDFAETFAYAMTGEDNKAIKSKKTKFLSENVPGFTL